MMTFREFVYRKSKEYLTNLVILLIGIILILAGIMSANWIGTVAESVVISVGASLVTSAIVSFLSSLYLFKRSLAKEVTETWGLDCITESRAVMNELICQDLDHATQYLDIIAYGMKALRETKSDVLRCQIKQGLKVRILTVDPSCKILTQRDIDEGKLPGSTADSINRLKEWADQCEVPDAIQIRFCKTLPTEMYFRVDNTVYVGPYQFKRESQRSITMRYHENSKGFLYYTGYFESLWKDSEFCHD